MLLCKNYYIVLILKKKGALQSTFFDITHLSPISVDPYILCVTSWRVKYKYIFLKKQITSPQL